MIIAVLCDALWHLPSVTWEHLNQRNERNPVLSSFPWKRVNLFVWVRDAPICPNRSSLFLPGRRYLIFHLIGSQTFVDVMHYCVALVTASSAVKAGDDDLLSAGQVGGPAHPVDEVCFLTAGTSVPVGSHQNHFLNHPLKSCCNLIIAFIN